MEIQALNENIENEWKKKLSKRKYEVLREGEIEKPNTGRYVKTKDTGMYHCEGCGAQALSSFSKIQDGSGYATFKLAPEDTGVKLARTYSIEKGEIVRVFCSTCDSILGFVDSDEARSADDLEQGRVVRTIHIHSEAVHLKRNFTFSNFKFLYSFILLVFFGIILALWYSLSIFYERKETGENDLRVWVGNIEVVVRPFEITEEMYREEVIEYFTSNDIVLVNLTSSTFSEIPLSSVHADVLWLNEKYTIIDYERNEEVGISEREHYTKPEGAMYVLFAKKNKLPEFVFRKGFVVYVVNI